MTTNKILQIRPNQLTIIVLPFLVNHWHIAYGICFISSLHYNNFFLKKINLGKDLQNQAKVNNN